MSRRKRMGKQGDGESGDVSDADDRVLEAVEALRKEMASVSRELSGFRADVEKSLNYNSDVMADVQDTLKKIMKENQDLKN